MNSVKTFSSIIELLNLGRLKRWPVNLGLAVVSLYLEVVKTKDKKEQRNEEEALSYIYNFIQLVTSLMSFLRL